MWFGRVHEAHPSLGPVIFTAAALYFIVQIVVAWVFVPSYSLVSNSISDLGDTSCGGYGSPGMCSPRWWLMNYAGFVLLGLIMVVGSALLYHEFTDRRPREQRAAMIGFALMALAGIGSILVGFFPENQNRTMHILGAFLAIAIGNVAILVLGGVLTLPESMRRSMLVFSSCGACGTPVFRVTQVFRNRSRNDGACRGVPGDDLVDHVRSVHLALQSEAIQGVHLETGQDRAARHRRPGQPLSPVVQRVGPLRPPARARCTPHRSIPHRPRHSRHARWDGRPRKRPNPVPTPQCTAQ